LEVEFLDGELGVVELAGDGGVEVGAGGFGGEAEHLGELAAEGVALGGTYSNARDINNRGWIVGDSWLVDNATLHATLWTREGMVDLNTFLDPSSAAAGWILAVAQALNDRGSITGMAVNTLTGDVRGFVLSPTP
jgi:probable HAF family extracellular repeat protein